MMGVVKAMVRTNDKDRVPQKPALYVVRENSLEQGKTGNQSREPKQVTQYRFLFTTKTHGFAGSPQVPDVQGVPLVQKRLKERTHHGDAESESLK